MSGLTLVFFLIFNLIRGSVGLFEKCCDLGKNRGSEGCGNFSAPDSLIGPSQRTQCLLTAELCCEEKNQDENCKKGVVEAKRSKKCSDTRENCLRCCEICLLGQLAGDENKSCQTKLNFNTQYLNIFQECCELAKQNIKKNETQDYEYEDYPMTKNLCEMLPGQLCQQICVPTPNSYYCSCKSGYVLMEDQKTCQLEREKPKPKAPSRSPVPNPERPVPLLRPKLSTAPCEEGNPCQQECSLTPNGQSCSCRPGYELLSDRVSCRDIDECLDNVHVCDPGFEICVNEEGGYRCEVRVTSTKIYETVASSTASTTLTPCPKGFVDLNGECVDVNECLLDNSTNICQQHEECLNTLGSFICRCVTGFRKDNTTENCIDINECQTKLHHCTEEQRCDNTIGSYICHRVTGCGTGYTLNANSGQCEDDDECILQTDNCRLMGAEFQCRNTQGSFRCERRKCSPGDSNCSWNCPMGYAPNTVGQCKDIDECRLKMHNCPPHTHSCVNVPGSFECRQVRTCPNGYEPSSSGCIDVDECAKKTDNCGPNTECRNHNGGFTCFCKAGYFRVSNTECEDIDECKRRGCPPTATCHNTPGSFYCTCHEGFQQVDRNRCQDIDECISQPGICDHQCSNTHGSYRCFCKAGFRLHENNRSCIDVDECDLFKNEKLCSGFCENIPGSFQCTCPPGYYLTTDRRTCQDVDECLKNPCRGPYEVCLNTRGSFACNTIRCPEGYAQMHDQRNSCRRISCREGLQKCLEMPATITFIFFSFVSKLPISSSGYLDFFTLRGSLNPGSDAHFHLELVSATSKNHENTTLATRQDFHLRTPSWNQAVVSLVRPVAGPQVLVS